MKIDMSNKICRRQIVELRKLLIQGHHLKGGKPSKVDLPLSEWNRTIGHGE